MKPTETYSIPSQALAGDPLSPSAECEITDPINTTFAREPTFTEAMKTVVGRREYWRQYAFNKKYGIDPAATHAMYVPEEEELPEVCRIRCRIPCDITSDQCLLKPGEVIRLRPNLIASDAKERLESAEPGEPDKKRGRPTLGERIVPENFLPKTKAKKGLIRRKPAVATVT